MNTKKIMCIVLCFVLCISLFPTKSKADSSDEIVKVLSTTDFSDEKMKIEYLIHDNILYISDEDGAKVSNMYCDMTNEGYFVRYYPGLEKSVNNLRQNKWVYNEFMYRSPFVKCSAEPYIYEERKYYPLKELMDSLGTSYFFDQDSNVIRYIPHYTEKEFKYLCFEYMSLADISLDETMGSFTGKIGTAIATSYDIVRNVRFDVLVDKASGYHTEKYESIIRDIVTSNVSTDKDSLFKTADFHGKVSDYSYRLSSDDRQKLKEHCEMCGYDKETIMRSYEMLAILYTDPLSLPEFIELLDSLNKMYNADAQYLRAAYYGTRNTANAEIQNAIENTIPKDFDSKNFSALFEKAVSNYILKYKLNSFCAEILFSEFFDVFFLALTIVGFDQATSDYVDLNHCNKLQVVAQKNVNTNDSQVEVKYATVFYILLSIYAIEKVEGHVSSNDYILIDNLLSISDKSLDLKINNNKLDTERIRENIKKAQLSEVSDLALYHIAFMYSNSGEDDIRMYKADLNNDCISDLLILNNENYSPIIIPGGYDCTLLLNDEFVDCYGKQLKYSSRLGTYYDLKSDTDMESQIAHEEIDIYDINSNEWASICNSEYDMRTDSYSSCSVGGMNVDSQIYNYYLDSVFLSSEEVPFLTGSYFLQFEFDSDLSSKEIYDELMKYSIFDGSFQDDLDGDGETDYILITGLVTKEKDDYPHKYKKEPAGISSDGSTELPYYWDDACLAIMSNYNDRNIEWMSCDSLLINLHKNSKSLPDGVYRVKIENLENYYKAESIQQVFDNKTATVTISSQYTIDCKQYYDLEVGDTISFKGNYDEGERLFIINKIINRTDNSHFIQLDHDWTLSQFSFDSEYGIFGSSDIPCTRNIYTQTLELADDVIYKMNCVYRDEDGHYTLEDIIIDDMNEYQDYIANSFANGDYYWTHRITIKDGKITEIYVYNIFFNVMVEGNYTYLEREDMRFV